MDANGFNPTYIAGGASLDWGVAPPLPPPDTTEPTITITTPPEGAKYTLNADVSAEYKCEDEAGGSGIKSCDGPVANGAASDTSSTGTKSFTVNAEDNVGNKTSLTHTHEVRSSLPPVAKDDSYSTDEDQPLTKPPPASGTLRVSRRSGVVGGFFTRRGRILALLLQPKNARAKSETMIRRNVSGSRCAQPHGYYGRQGPGLYARRAQLGDVIRNQAHG